MGFGTRPSWSLDDAGGDEDGGLNGARVGWRRGAGESWRLIGSKKAGKNVMAVSFV